jgi:hypothetical protein
MHHAEPLKYALCRVDQNTTSKERMPKMILVVIVHFPVTRFHALQENSGIPWR